MASPTTHKGKAMAAIDPGSAAKRLSIATCNRAAARGAMAMFCGAGRFRLLWVCLAAGVALGAAEAQAPVNVRVALVIGNAAYPVSPLINSINDQRAMGQALRDLGFQVLEVRDGSKAQMASAIEATRRALAGKHGVAMFYYAGHGMQLNWHNYLIPVDAKLMKAQDVVDQTVDVDAVMTAFKSADTRMNILVLDACRDNPFSETASGKGLAPVDAPPGTFLAYATAPGNVARDGSEASGHGLYTQYLIEELKKPDARIEDVFKRVRTQVRRQSKGRQIPWESTSLEEDFYFDRLRVAMITQPLAPGSPEALAKQQSEFEAEKADWDSIRDSDRPDEFFAYLTRYPNGYMSEQAQFRLDQLQKPRIEAQLKKNETPSLQSGVRRFEVGDEFVYEVEDRIAFKTYTRKDKVISADDKTVVFRSGNILDQMGSILNNRFGKKDPGILQVPADIFVGKKWRSAFTNTAKNGYKSQNFWDFRVTGIENVTVPAGRFLAFRLERTGAAVGPSGRTTMTGTIWIDPKTMQHVKSELTFFSRGRRAVDETIQLVSSHYAQR